MHKYLFIFFFFLSQQLIDALDLARWSRKIARQDDIWLWEFFFGDMRRFPSLISGVIVLALFESAKPHPQHRHPVTRQRVA